MALTKYKEGSIIELLSISLPLMLSSFSVVLMWFVDRLLLAHYSTSALNAAVTSSTLGWAFVFGFMVLTGISEVFVAQYNGAGRKEKLGEPVWQMIWLSLASILLFMPLGYWASDWFYPNNEMENIYFQWMMYFGPFFNLYTALCGFFIGQGKTRLITLLALGTNVLNAGLDLILIWGIEGWIPAMGVKGAAIATSSSSIFQAFVLFAIFLKRSNRETYGTGRWALELSSLWQCVKVGAPNAIFVSIEVMAWALYYWMMTLIGERHITIVGICQSVAILFFFFAEGVSKAAITIAGNLIGAKREFLVAKVLKSGLKLHLLFMGLIMALFYLFSETVVDQFLPNADAAYIDDIRDSLIFCMGGILVYIFFEGIRLLLSGLLTASGDTVFLLIGGSLSVWILLVAPVYGLVVLQRMPVEVASVICIFYGASASLVYYLRFQTGKWKQISLTATP